MQIFHWVFSFQEARVILEQILANLSFYTFLPFLQLLYRSLKLLEVLLGDDLSVVGFGFERRYSKLPN